MGLVFSYLPVLALLLLVLAAALWALRTPRVAPGRSPSLAYTAATRHAGRGLRLAWAALIAVPTIAPAIAFLFPLTGAVRRASVPGPVLASLAMLGGIAFVGVLASSELSWPRPEGAIRRAPLVRRRWIDVTPRGWLLTTTGILGALTLTLALGGVAAGWRSILHYGHARLARESSPFPGWTYGVPLLAIAVLLAAGTVATLSMTARRPPVSETAPDDDEALRRSSARRLLAGVQFAYGLTLAGTLFFTAGAIARVEPRWADVAGPGSSRVLGNTGMLVALAIPLVVGAIAIVATREPRPRRLRATTTAVTA